MSYLLVTRQVSVLFMDAHPNYVASCQIFIYGNRGFIYNVQGARFYKHVAEAWPKILSDLQVDSIEGYVLASHARLIRVALRKVATISIKQAGEMAGHVMFWIVIERRS